MGLHKEEVLAPWTRREEWPRDVGYLSGHGRVTCPNFPQSSLQRGPVSTLTLKVLAALRLGAASMLDLRLLVASVRRQTRRSGRESAGWVGACDRHGFSTGSLCPEPDQFCIAR